MVEQIKYVATDSLVLWEQSLQYQWAQEFHRYREGQRTVQNRRSDYVE